MDRQLKEFEERLNRKFDKVDERFDQVDERFDRVDKRFEQVDKRFDEVRQRFADLGQRVGVLHEEAMAEFRFSLEAVQGAKEELSKKFDERADGIESTLELIARAVRANLPKAAKR